MRRRGQSVKTRRRGSNDACWSSDTPSGSVFAEHSKTKFKQVDGGQSRASAERDIPDRVKGSQRC
jgi:hypothetical protein